MKAIVLTYDERAPYVDLVLSCYKRWWKNCPLEFVIPYNKELPYYKDKFGNLSFIKTPKNIKSTMHLLLKNIPDDDFVYWCLDDIYLHALNNPEILNDIYKYIIENPNCEVNSIRLKHIKLKHINRASCKTSKERIGEIDFCNISYTKLSFWFHYFIRSKVLKQFFLSPMISTKTSIRDMGRLKKKINIDKCRILVPERKIATFGETTRGKVSTKNCGEAFKLYKIKSGIKNFSRMTILDNRARKT